MLVLPCSGADPANQRAAFDTWRRVQSAADKDERAERDTQRSAAFLDAGTRHQVPALLFALFALIICPSCSSYVKLVFNCKIFALLSIEYDTAGL